MGQVTRLHVHRLREPEVPAVVADLSEHPRLAVHGPARAVSTTARAPVGLGRPNSGVPAAPILEQFGHSKPSLVTTSPGLVSHSTAQRAATGARGRRT